MHRFVNGDTLGSIVLLAIGIFVTSYTLTHYSLGRLNNMGPGMVPMLLGGILVGLGAALLLLGLLRGGERIYADHRTALFVLSGVILFALSIERAGMVPAIVLLIVTSTLPDRKFTFSGRLVLAAGVSVVTVLIFKLGLGMPYAIVKWPF